MLIRFNALSYSLKVWLTSVLAGPILFFTIDFFKHYGYNEINSDWLDGYFLFVIFGGIFSFITWFVFYFLIRLIVTSFYSQRNRLKHYIAFLGIVLTVLTFLIANSRFIRTDINNIITSYAFTIAAGSLIYKLDIETEPEPEG